MITMMNRSIEPGLLRLFRYFAGVATIYFAILWGYAILTTGWNWPNQVEYWGSFTFYGILLIYLFIPWIQQRLKRLFLPFGLGMSTLFPVLNNIVYLVKPSQTDVMNIITRSWLWLPVLFVPLVLIAWQYNFRSVLAFTIFTNASELLVLLHVLRSVTLETMPIIGVPIIRAFAFGIVGQVVIILVDTQRAQRLKLIQANVRLGQYANTLEQLATSRERNRLASELHDTLAHTLSGLAVNLEAIKTVVPPADGETQAMLDHALRTTRLGLDETRRALKALRAGPLEDLGLRLALKALAESASQRASIAIDFVCPAELPPLPLDLEQNVYRITQEALENVVRHSNAGHASVELHFTGEQLHLTIADDGDGFDPAGAAVQSRLGLRGLRERATLLGGQLKIDSRPGQGARVIFTWEGSRDQSVGL